MDEAITYFVYFAGALLTFFPAFYFSFSLPKKSTSQKLLIVHLLALGMFVFLRPNAIGVAIGVPMYYRFYLRMFIVGMVSAPLLFLAVRSMQYKLTKRVVVLSFSFALFAFILYILPYHKKIFNHYNVFLYENVGTVSAEANILFDRLNRIAQVLAVSFFLVASIQALIIRKHLKSAEKKQVTLLACGATVFFILFTYATIFEEWMYIYYGTLINAFFVTFSVWSEARNVHENLVRITPLLQMEAATYLTRFRHPADKFSALLKIKEIEEFPDRVMVIRGAGEDGPGAIDTDDMLIKKVESAVFSILGVDAIITSTARNELSVIINSASCRIENEQAAAEKTAQLHDKLANNGIESGIGCGAVKSFESLPESFREAVNALDYIHSLSNKIPVHVSDVPRIEEKELFPYQLKKSLLDEVGQGNFTSSNRILEELLPIIKQISLGHQNVLRIRVHELVIAAIEEGLNAGADKDELNKINEGFFKIIPISDDDTFFEKTFSSFKQVCELINNSKESHYDSVIERAKEYIEEHFNEDITVAEVAEKVALSTSYFMALLKKYTGMPFTDYLRNVRVNQAKRLIKESDMNMTEIANAVGISNSAYFSAQFKKVEGITPSQFKKQN